MNAVSLMLDEEIKLNKRENWNKLDKTMKLKRLNEFADSFCHKHEIADEIRRKKLKEFLKQKLNQRRFNTNKDLMYDIEKGVIVDIPTLFYEEGIFILERIDSRNSTAKGLTPTKKN